MGKMAVNQLLQPIRQSDEVYQNQTTFDDILIKYIGFGEWQIRKMFIIFITTGK